MIVYGEMILRLMERFKDFRGPRGEHFSRTLLRELLMGRLSDAWQREQQAKANLQASLDEANKTIEQLMAEKVKTPGGEQLDEADLKTVDEIVAANPPETDGVPVPDVAAPSA